MTHAVTRPGNGSYPFSARCLTTGSESGLIESSAVVNCNVTPTCTFAAATVSASNYSPSCNVAVNLSAGCSGDCTGVTYAWSGPNLPSSNGSTASVTPPAANGTNTYTVTLSKSGCTAKTQTVNVTVSGCAPPPCPVANGNYLSAIDTKQCSAINGWAMDLNCKEQSITLGVYIGGSFVENIAATGDRSDVRDAHNEGGSNIKYGFSWIPTFNGTKEVSLRYPNGNNLPGSPFTLTCGDVCVGVSVSTPSVTNPSVTVGGSTDLTASCLAGETAQVFWNNSWQASGISSGALNTAGTLTYRARCLKNTCVGTENTGTITVNPAAVPAPVAPNPAIGNQTGTVSVVFPTLNVSFTGLGISYSATGLPPGLSINPSTGAITGTPTTSGTYPVIITATNAGGSATVNFTITVQPATVTPPTNHPPVAVVTPNQLGTVAVTITFTVNAFTDADNDNLTYTLTGLPGELTFNPATRQVTGVPSAATSYPLTVNVTDGKGGAASTTFTLTIQAAPVTNGRVSILAPQFVCPPGGNQGVAQLTFQAQTTPANQAVEYNAIGITGWSSSAGPYTFNAFNDAPNITLNARLTSEPSVQVSLVWDWKAYCTPPPTPSINEANQVVCAGTSVQLTARNCAGGTLTWPGNNTGGAYQFTANQTTTVTVACVGANGLSSSSAGVTITVNAVPAAPVVTVTQPTCGQTQGTLTVTSPLGTYDYNFGSGWGTGVSSAQAVGNHTVRIRYTGGTCEASSLPAVISAPSAPTTTPTVTVAPTGAVCVGTTIALTAGNCTGTGSGYQWYKNNVAVAGETAALYQPTAALNDTYKVACTLNSCAGSTFATATPSITTNPINKPNITGIPTQAVCSGTEVTLTADNCTTYKWYNGTTELATTAQYKPPVTATATYRVVCTNGLCEGPQETATVTVKALPANGPSLLTRTPTGDICAGTSVGLTATGCTLYKWFKGTVEQSSTISELTDSPTATAIYSVACVTTEGCISTQRQTNSVTVKSKPTTTPNITGAPTAACVGSTLDMTASDCATNEGYQWYNGSTPTVAVANYKPTVITGDSYKVVCTLNGCVGSGFRDASVSILASPVLTGMPAGAVCAGTSVNLAGSGCTTYQWYRGTALINGATNSAFTETIPSGTTSYGFKCVTGGCTAALTAQTITLKPLAGGGSPDFTGLPTAVCANTPFTLTGSGCTNTAYQWYRNGAAIAAPEGIATTLQETITANTVYGITCRAAANECDAPITSKTVTLKPNPTTTPTITGAPTVAVCAGTVLGLTADGCTGTGSGYQWYKNNVAVAGETAALYQPTAAVNDSYKVACSLNSCVGSMFATTTPNITAKPTIKPTLTGIPTQAVCSGTEVTLTAANCPIGTSYKWYSPTAEVATTAQYKPTLTTDITYRAVCTNGTCEGLQETAAFTVKPLAGSPGFSGMPSGDICQNTPLTLTGAGCAASAYQWLRNGQPIQNATTTNVLTDNVPGGTTTYGLNCIATTSQCTPLPTNQSIRVKSLAGGGSPNFTGMPTAAVCIGTQVNLTGTNCSTNNYQWYRNGNAVAAPEGIAVSFSEKVVTTTTTYGVTCRPALNECDAPVTTKTLSINPPAPAAPNVTVSDPTCGQTQGTLAIQTPVAGNQFSFDDGASWATTTSASKPAGPYNIRQRVGSAGCASVSTDKTITTPPDVPATIPTIAGGPSGAVCSGTQVQLTASNCTAYTWYEGATPVSVVAQYSPTVTGNVTYRVVCSNGTCEGTERTVSITVNPKPTATLTANGVLSCTNPTRQLTALGGAPYYFAGPVINNYNQTTGLATVAAAGQYSVTVTGGNGCTNTAQVTMTGDGTFPIPSITMISSTGANLCPGGAITLDANPAGMASYSWTRPNGTTSNGSRLIATEPGSYVATVTNGNGCQASVSVALTNSISPTPTLSTTMAGLAPNSVSVTLTAGGCTGGTVTWNTGDTGTRIVKAATLTATTYSATCQTPNQCVSDAATVSVQAPNPTPPSLRRPSKVIICGPQAVTLTADGCTAANMRIVWPDGQTGSSIVVTPTVTTTYTAACWMGEVRSAPSNSELVTVSNSHALALAGATIYAENQPLALTATATPAGNYTYVWSGLPTSNTTTTNALTVAAPAPGSYTLTATASSSTGCTAQATAVLTVTAANAITTLALSQTAACAGGVLSVPFTSTGAFAGGYNFTVQLSDASGSFASATILTGTANASPAQVTLPANLAPGSGYRVRVVSTSPAINGTPSPTTLTIGGSSTISLTPSATALSCSTPTLTLSATGGATGTAYLWNNGATTPTLSVSVAGAYALTLTTAGGCTATASTSVSNAPDALTVGIANSQTSVCTSVSALTLTAQPSTTANVSYRWNGPPTPQGGLLATTPVLSISIAGVYSVTITNGTSCSATASTTVTLGQTPSLTVAIPSATTVGQPLSLTALLAPSSGGTASYRWTGPNSFTATDTTPILSFTAATTALNGTYTVLVTLPGGCTLSGTGNLTVGTPPTSTTVSGLSVGAITPTTLCAGAVVTVPFSVNGTVSAGTTFQAQLSDATGAFPTSATTGAGLSLTSTTSPLSLTIPANALPGSGYRVRVVSSDPQTGTALSPSVLTVGGLSSLTVAVPPATTVVGNPVSLTALVTPAPPTAAYAWNGPNSFTALTTSNVLSFSVSTTALSGQYTVVATLPGGCTVSGTGNLTIGTPATSTATECDIRIVARDAQNKETSKIPRTGPQSLTLSVESLDGTALTGNTYQWTRSISTSAGATTTALGNSPTISATAIGEYKVVVTGTQGASCIAYLTLSKGLCQTVTQTYQCGTRPATPVGTPGSPVLTNLAPGDTIRTGDFDVVVTEVTGGGASGWQGKGYTAIPYLKNQRIAVELNGAVVNDCYELMSGTVVSAYDADWGGVRDVNAVEQQLLQQFDQLRNILSSFQGTQAEKEQIQVIVSQLISQQQSLSAINPNNPQITSLGLIIDATRCLALTASATGRVAAGVCTAQNALATLETNSEKAVGIPGPMGCLIAAVIDYGLQYTLSWGKLNYVDNQNVSFTDFARINSEVSLLDVGVSCGMAFFGLDSKTANAIVAGVTSIVSVIQNQVDTFKAAKHREPTVEELVDQVKANFSGVLLQVVIETTSSFIAQAAGEKYGVAVATKISQGVKAFFAKADNFIPDAVRTRLNTTVDAAKQATKKLQARFLGYSIRVIRPKINPNEFRVGLHSVLTVDFSSLSMQSHHIPSAKFMDLLRSRSGFTNLVIDFRRNTCFDCVAIMVEGVTNFGSKVERHNRTKTYGLKPNSQAALNHSDYFNLSPNDAVVADVEDLVNIFKADGLWNSETHNALKELIDQNSIAFPALFNKNYILNKLGW